MDARSAIKHYLGVASFVFGAVSVVKPGLPAKLTGSSEQEARELGFRDLAVGLAIYASPRVGVAQRGLLDIGDALAFAKRRPAIVPVALATAAMSAYYLVSSR